jgi:aquaporin NIP
METMRLHQAGRVFRRNLFAEAVGTFFLVFAGTGAIVINDLSHGAVSHVGISLTFGLVVLSMIYSLGSVSGCHLNPAVTLGFFLARRFPGREVAGYAASQCLGAVLASIVLRLMFPEHPTLGATVPAGTDIQSFILEFILTLMLMFVVLSVATGAKEESQLAGVAIGSMIALEALFAGPISGASMNPARSLAPAFVTGQLLPIWIYIAAPLLGAITAVGLYGSLHTDQPRDLKLDES